MRREGRCDVSVLVIAATWHGHDGRELYPGLKDRIIARYNAQHSIPPQEPVRTSGTFAKFEPKAPTHGTAHASAGRYSIQVEAVKEYEAFGRQLASATAMVVEATVTNMDIGLKIGKAIAWKKPVLCLYTTHLLVIDHDFPLSLTDSELVSMQPYLGVDDPGLDGILENFFRRVAPERVAAR